MVECYDCAGLFKTSPLRKRPKLSVTSFVVVSCKRKRSNAYGSPMSCMMKPVSVLQPSSCA